MADFLGSIAQVARAADYLRKKRLEDEQLALQREDQAYQREIRDRQRKKWALEDELLPLEMEDKKRAREREKTKEQREDAAYEKENFRPKTMTETGLVSGMTPAVNEAAKAMAAAAGMPVVGPTMVGPALSGVVEASPVPGTRTERDIPLSTERKQQADAATQRAKWAREDMEFQRQVARDLMREDRADRRQAISLANRGRGRTQSDKKTRGMPFTGTIGQQKFSLPVMPFSGSVPSAIPLPAQVSIPVTGTSYLNGNMLTIPEYGSLSRDDFANLTKQDFDKIMQKYSSIIPEPFVMARNSKMSGNPGRGGQEARQKAITNLTMQFMKEGDDQNTAYSKAISLYDMIQSGKAPNQGPLQLGPQGSQFMQSPKIQEIMKFLDQPDQQTNDMLFLMGK